ncbi:MAG: ABC transporter ATP-binding protein [Bacteriovoracaceae bacterium]
MIIVKNISQTFKVAEKEPGFLGSFKSLFRKKWITKFALTNINLEIKQGEVVGLIGANGAGKTTLIKILSGIIYPTSGNASVLGFNPWERDNRLRKQMSLIMGQKAQLWWDLPAMDCFLLLKEIYQIPDAEFEHDLKKLSEQLNISSQLKVQVRSLSLGERMKVELMAALLHRPKVIFLDEPTIGLDISSQKAIRKFLQEYQRDYKPIIILTSHYMEDIEELCERVIIVKNGSIVYDGDFKKIADHTSQEKSLTAHLKNKISAHDLALFPEELGKISQVDELTLKVNTHKDNLTTAVAKVLSLYPINDLSIEAQDITDIIEKIMKEGLSSV